MKPLRIYLDNCSLNDIAPKDKKWEETEIGEYLFEHSLSGEIEVFSSPAGVIEIALNKDLDQRQNMAMNTLIRGQRMMASKEFYIIDDFLRLVEATWNNSTKTKRLEFLKANSARVYIALLGQLAALKDYDCSKGFIGVVAPKIATQIIHSKIFENPKEEIEKRIEAIKNNNYSHLDYFNEFENMGIDRLSAMQKEYEEKEYKSIDKKAITYLQKNQDILIDGYSLDELSFAADQVFVYWEDLNSTIIDFRKIASQWTDISPIEKEHNFSFKPLDATVIKRFEENLQTVEDCRYILKSLVNRFHKQTTFTRVSNYIIIKDIEKGLTNGKIPSGGIILDSSHCIAALYNEILLSRDQRLNASVDFWFKQIKKDTGLFRETAKNLNELKRQVEKGLGHCNS